MLNPWKIILVGALISTLGLGGMTFYAYVLNNKLKIERSAKELAQANNKKCQDDKLITSEASDDYQKKLSALNLQLANLKRLRDNPRCVPITR